MACSDASIRSFALSSAFTQRHQSPRSHGENEALRVACRSDGSVIASGGGDGVVALYPRHLAEPLDRFTCGGSEVYALQFESDTRLLVGCDNALTRWDAVTAQCVDKAEFEHGTALPVYGGARNPERKCFVFDAHAQDGLVSVALSDGSIQVVSADGFKPLHVLRTTDASSSSTTAAAAAAAATSCRFAGDALVTTAGDCAMVWDVRALRAPVLSVRSPDARLLYGARLMTGSDCLLTWGGELVEAWTASSGKPQWRARLHGYPAFFVDEADGALVVCGGGQGRPPDAACCHDHGAKRPRTDHGGFYVLCDVATQRRGVICGDFVAFAD